MVGTPILTNTDRYTTHNTDMAHNITNTDSLLLANKSAWHGLGTILPDAFSIKDALTAGRLDWEVNMIPLQTVPLLGGANDGARIDLSHRATVRSDTNTVLGVVSNKYSVLNNRTMLEVAEEAVAAMGGEVKLESCGSFQGGRKVFACIRTATFEAAKNDVVSSYALLSNSHDGTSSFEMLNTSVRVVCNNTLNIALKGNTNKTRRRHTANMLAGVPDIIRQLVYGRDASVQFKETAQHLASRKLPNDATALQQMYQKVYVNMFGKPENAAAERKAQALVSTWETLLQNDRNTLGNSDDMSYWSMLNSITEWADHQRTVRGEGDDKYADRRMLSNLYGTSADVKDKALYAVLSM